MEIFQNNRRERIKKKGEPNKAQHRETRDEKARRVVQLNVLLEPSNDISC